MKCTNSAVLLLALLALVQSEAEWDEDASIPVSISYGDNYDQDYSCSQNYPLPKITQLNLTAYDQGCRMYKINGTIIREPTYNPVYGLDYVLYCSSENADHIELKENGESLQTDKVNSTTIRAYINKPNVNEYEYTCEDSGTGKKDYLLAAVTPSMSINSSFNYNKHYFVPLGENFEVSCTGNDAEYLHIENEEDNSNLPTVVVNDTTVLYVYKAPANTTAHMVYYWCNRKSNSRIFVGVTVDYYPKTHDLGCYIFTDVLAILQCQWGYRSDNYIWFTLFYTNGDIQNAAVLALTQKAPGRLNNLVKLNINDDVLVPSLGPNGNLTVILETCNLVFCHNETLSVRVGSVGTKPEGPKVEDLETYNLVEHGLS